MRGVAKQYGQEISGGRRTQDRPAEPVTNEQRQISGVVDVGVA
jgi:hypothetical protein